MIKIFLVEDEFVVREGIKNNIDWSGEGFHFCGDAADGELAYPRIQIERPDIIITDIRMPFMNGLELSRLVKNELPQTKIIILSGHEEFSYAQEAIKIGITEYLLKPISGVELMKTVKRVGKQILRERIEKENLARYKREMEENETDIKRRFLNEIVAGSLSTAVILERGKELGFELSAQIYQLVLFRYNFNCEEEGFSDELVEISRELSKITGNSNVLMFDRAIEGRALLFKSDSLEQLETLREETLFNIKKLLGRHPDVCFFGGIGTAVGRLTRLRESYETAARAFARRFIMDCNDIITCDEISELIHEDSASKNALELGNIDLKKAEDFLRSGEAEEITFFVEAFLKSIGIASEKSILFKQYVLMNVYFTVLSFLKEIGGAEVLTEEIFPELDGMKEVFNDSQKSKAYMVRIFTIALTRRDALRSKRYHCVIDQAKKYLNEHYIDEDLTLNEIAAYVNISPSHFSTVYSRETGNTFIKDLTELRLNKAKELLKFSDMRCSDISMAVGYKDPHYFSYLFKKVQNCTPMQYRTQGGKSSGN